MKNFKQILSLISEAKLEPGGKDLGVIFAANSIFSPNKGIKEPSAETRFTKGDLDYRLMPYREPKSEPKSKSKLQYMKRLFDKYGRRKNPWNGR